MLVVGVLVGAWIPRRQWRCVSVETGRGGLEVNLLERIEKLEEDLRSSTTVVRVLSRQLEKLGIRFRVTRKALKDPIAKVAEKLSLIELYKLERERQQKMAEDEEVKRLRKELVNAC